MVGRPAERAAAPHCRIVLMDANDGVGLELRNGSDVRLGSGRAEFLAALEDRVKNGGGAVVTASPTELPRQPG